MATARSLTYKLLEPIRYRGRRFPAGRIVTFREKTASRFLADGLIVQVPAPSFRDIMAEGIRFPERALILGSGPNGRAHHARIPRDRFVLALNLAVTAPVRADLWVAMDPTLKDQRWFQDAIWGFREPGLDLGPGAIGAGGTVPLMERKRVARHFPWVRCTFWLEKLSMMSPGDVEPRPDHIRPGGTVAGAALQLCLHCGVTRVDLCGIDMFGDVYFDGSLHRRKQRKGQAWGSRKVLGALIKCLQGKGMEIRSLSETALDIEIA